MRVVDIIIKKRDGHALSAVELAYLIDGYVQGSIPEYQVAAWAMAVFFKGMSAEETAHLSQYMLDSGRTISLENYGLAYVDKHSTGGVGDKTSLVIAPILASLGVKVPMMSGRALGHTGGTLDKLESIPGYRTNLSIQEFKQALAADGMAMIGQSSEIVPADRLLYALRDVTGTVESIPLITASILSKKVAEGADALVFDVKHGSGAFMKNLDDAMALAESLVNTGRSMGKRISAVISNMDEPLGNKVGNFLEVEEALDCLEGRGPKDLNELNRELAAHMLMLSGKTKAMAEAYDLVQSAIENGTAMESFLRNVSRQGGSVKELLKKRNLWRSEYSGCIYAPEDGIVQGIDALTCGQAGVYLGVGRNTSADRVSPLAGIEFMVKTGSPIKKGQALLKFWGQSEQSLRIPEILLTRAITIGPEIIKTRPIVTRTIDSV